mgnify:CR=1 FL=1
MYRFVLAKNLVYGMEIAFDAVVIGKPLTTLPLTYNVDFFKSKCLKCVDEKLKDPEYPFKSIIPQNIFDGRGPEITLANLAFGESFGILNRFIT